MFIFIHQNNNFCTGQPTFFFYLAEVLLGINTRTHELLVQADFNQATTCKARCERFAPELFQPFKCFPARSLFARSLFT